MRNTTQSPTTTINQSKHNNINPEIKLMVQKLMAQQNPEN
jgi:hypothetical protein